MNPAVVIPGKELSKSAPKMTLIRELKLDLSSILAYQSILLP